jgi:hypothetical protein
MALVTFLGGDETGNVAHCDWGRFRFTIGQPTECDDPHIVAKATGNRFFRVESPGSQTTPEAPVERIDPLAKARAAKAAKRAAEAGDAA